MNYKSYADLSTDILLEIHKVPSNIQLVVGIPRSGMVPAYMIAAQLNLPVTSLDAFLTDNYGAVGERQLRGDLNSLEHVLIIDDSIYSGTAMNKAKAKLKAHHLNVNYQYAAIYSATEENDMVDFYFKYVPQPRVFQWNYKNHFITTQSCYDIDGVLCEDPTEAENDDGEKYRNFLLNAKPLFVPSYKIPCLVTSRLEKYRPETEAWLKKQEIAYGELIMLDLPTAQERRALGIHGKFKADIYAARGELYFVESSWEQAKTIFEITKKPVFCTYNDVFIKTYIDIVYYENAIKYTNRHFSDIFSDTSEIGEKYQQLKMDYDAVYAKKQQLELRVSGLKQNKWLVFSKLGTKDKFLFLMKLFLKKIGL